MRFKKTLLIGVGSALMFTMGGVGPAQADGGKHISSALAANSGVGAISTSAGRCASCHRAHTAKAEKLLKQAQPQLCYSCHDGTLAQTNVIDGNDGLTGLRGGGFTNARINGGLATKTMGALDLGTGRIATTGQTIGVLPGGAPVTSKHNAGGTPADEGTAWGNGANDTASLLGKKITLECGSCHDPHGNGNYRILRPIPIDSGYVSREIKAAVVASLPGVTPVVLAAPAVMSPAAGINIPDVPVAIVRNYGTGNYWLSGDTTVPIDATATLTGTAKATDVAPDGYINNIANWCTTCHTRYLAGSGSYATALPGTSAAVAASTTAPWTSAVAANVDANFTYRHRSDANYKAGAANCITCHVSHGSNVAAGGGLNPGDTPAAAGDSRLLRVNDRGTCSMCHNV